MVMNSMAKGPIAAVTKVFTPHSVTCCPFLFQAHSLHFNWTEKGLDSVKQQHLMPVSLAFGLAEPVSAYQKCANNR